MKPVVEFLVLAGVALFILFQVALYQWSMCLFERFSMLDAVLVWVRRNKWLLGVIAAFVVGFALW